MGILDREDLKNRRFAAGLSLAVSLVLIFVKFWAYNLTQSKAIFSDALESVVNVVAAAMALFVIYYANKPVDRDHPYGHGKVEFFSASVEGILITFAGVLIIIDSVNAMFRGHSMQELGLGLALTVGAGFVNLFLGIYLLSVGKKNKSAALEASGQHVLSDFYTSVAVLAGLLVVWGTGLTWLDPVVAVFVGMLLIYSGMKVVRNSIRGLMDEEDPKLMEDLRDSFLRTKPPGIIQIHHVKVIRSGWFHHIDAHLVVPEFWNVNEVHDNITAFERRVLKDYEYSGELNFHVDPCRQAYCKHCAYENCEIRKEPYVEDLPIDVEDLRSPYEPEPFRPY
jgi:cation diffusion facilitator family transporter